MPQTQPGIEDFLLRQLRHPQEEEEEEDYFDYFYDEPGSEPGTLSIEPDAPLPALCWWIIAPAMPCESRILVPMP